MATDDTATEGDIAISRPGLLDMLGRAKWDSWHKQKGKEKDTAKRQYVEALLNVSLPFRKRAWAMAAGVY